MRAGFFVHVLLALFVTLIPATVRAQSPERMPGEQFRVEVGTVWWQPTPELTIRTDALSTFGIADFDFAEEFSLEKKRFSEFRVVLKPGRAHKVRVSYVPVKYDQTSPLQRPISFDGTTFAGSATAILAWDLWRFGYEWDFVSRERGFFGLLTELKYNKVQAAVRGRGAAEATEAQAPIPAIGVIGRRYVHRNVSISGEFTGFKFTGGGVEGTFFDFDISAVANLFRNFGVQGGYRAVTADYIVDEDSGDLKLKGPYFGIVSRF